MDRAGEQLLARPAGAVDQHRAFALRQKWQEFEYLPDRRAASDDVGKAVLPLKLLPEIFDQGQITERFDAADHLSAAVLEHGGRDADRNPLAFDAQDVNRLVDNRAACRERLAQRARRLADTGAEHIAAATSERFLAADSRDAFGPSVERSDLPVSVHREHPVVDRVEDDTVEFVDRANSHRAASSISRKYSRWPATPGRTMPSRSIVPTNRPPRP